MKFEIIFILIFKLISSANCEKKFRFLKTEICGSRNILMAVEKCEFKNDYLSLKCHTLQPIIKSEVNKVYLLLKFFTHLSLPVQLSFAVYIIENNKSREIFKSPDKLDWCQMVQGLKMKQNPIVKIFLSDFKEQIRFIFTCPMKDGIDLEKVRLFDKIGSFFPMKTFRYKEKATFASADGKKDELSVSMIFEHFDDGK